MTTDKFGITELYQTISGGREWFSKWDNGHARTFTESDPDDLEFITQNGNGEYKTDGNGILKISGSVPRMYVMKPDLTGYWHNVEITVYGLKNIDSFSEDAGIFAYARTNHEVDTDYCDTRGYTGRFTFEGRTYFEKEIKHGSSYVPVSQKWQWTTGMPRNIWFGYKYIIYDLPDGNVKHELWMDQIDGLNNGNWKKVNEFIDTGNNWGIGETPCKTSIDPAIRLTNSDLRPGSETGKPNLAVYFKSDDIGTEGLWFKKTSIREIQPPI